MWIGKSYFDPKEPENIAYDGEYIPNKIVGYIGEDWQSFGFPGIDEHNSTPFKTKSGIKMRNTSITWTEELDRLVVPTDGDDGGTIPKNDEKIYDGGEVATHRHTIKIAHAIQYGLAGSNTALVKLKDALVEGAKGNYLTTMKPANFFYTQGNVEHRIYQQFEFYNKRDASSIQYYKNVSLVKWDYLNIFIGEE